MDNIIESQKKVDSTNDILNSHLPFNLTHPELNLITYSEFVKLYFNDILYLPSALEFLDYIERPSGGGLMYLYAVRRGKIGILKMWYKENFWGKIKPKCDRIIPCMYVRIDKLEDMFVCYKRRKIVYRNMDGYKMS